MLFFVFFLLKNERFYFTFRPMAEAPTNLDRTSSLSCRKLQSSNATESDGQTSELSVCTFRFKPTNTTETGVHVA
jgi:hypothetical protein